MSLTKEEIDKIFNSLADDSISLEINKQAKEMFAVARKSDHFRAAVAQFISASMQSITAAGFVPDAAGIVLCATFLLGQRFSEGSNIKEGEKISEEPIDRFFLDKMMKNMEENWEKGD